MSEIFPLKDLFKNLLFSKQLFRSADNCELATKLYLEYVLGNPRPSSINALAGRLHIGYRKAIFLVRTLMKNGIIAWVDIPPNRDREMAGGKGKRWDLMVLPPRETLGVLEFACPSIEINYQNIEDALAYAEMEYDKTYGDFCFAPFEEAYGFEEVIPLLTSPKVFIFSYSSYLLRRRLLELEDGIVFVTRRATILEFTLLRNRLQEIATEFEVKNYFCASSLTDPQLKEIREKAGDIRLIAVHNSVVREDRYVLIGPTLVVCHSRPSPYRRKCAASESVYDRFYAVDVINRNDAIKQFKGYLESWADLGLAKELPS